MKLGLRFYGGIVAIALAVVLFVCAMIARGPDREFHFSRLVRSDTDPITLAKALDSVQEWPKWFYSLKDAEIVDAAKKPLPSQTIRQGSYVLFHIEPKDKQWKRFEVLAQITEYIPGKKLGLLVIEDSKHKISSLFDRLEWEVSLLPNTATTTGTSVTGTLIQGKAMAHTASWRSRLMGTLVEKILMSQVFYPNLLRLGEYPKPEEEVLGT